MKKYIAVLLAVFISACSNDNALDLPEIGRVQAVVATIAADYLSGAHSIVGETAGEYAALNELAPGGSDVFVASYGSFYYIVDRSAESVTKYAFSNPGEVIWQFTTKNSATDTGSNPHAMVFVNDQKAYILRYGKTTAWIVNPSALIEADFKIGELDLSAYSGTDGIPDMDNGVVVGNQLFIAMQRLENFSPSALAYIAVFDINTDIEIDTNTDSVNGFNGIPLEVRNPFSDVVYDNDSGLIYVQAFGSFFSPQFTGGVEVINPITYASSIVLDDGDETTHPYGNIASFAIRSATSAYFVGYDGFTDNNLYKFNPTTKAVEQSSIAALQDVQISNIIFDNSGRLWVSDSSNATVYIINADTDEVIDMVSTVLNPGTVAFPN